MFDFKWKLETKVITIIDSNGEGMRKGDILFIINSNEKKTQGEVKTNKTELEEAIKKLMRHEILIEYKMNPPNGDSYFRLTF